MLPPISVPVCKQMIKAGIWSVISHKDYLNAINIYPVPDGDTGTNIVATLKPLLIGIDAYYSWPDLLGYIQDTVLLSSRGNSWTVLSQRFQWRCNALIIASHSSQRSISIQQFHDACCEWYQSALGSFSLPQEGTILDAMRAMCEISVGPEYRNTMLEDVATATEYTRHTMKRIRNKDLPDAGAVGFYQFLIGMCSVIWSHDGANAQTVYDPWRHDWMDDHISVDTDSVDTDTSTTDTPSDNTKSDHHLFGAEWSQHHSMTFRYCTELVLQDSKRTVAQRRDELSGRWDSLQIVSWNHHLKIHIHTDTPDDLLNLCEQHAHIVDYKSDDMKQMIQDHTEYLSSSDLHWAKKVPVMLVIDSGCDLPETRDVRLPMITISTPIVNKTTDEPIMSMSWQQVSDIYERMHTDCHFVPITSQPSLYACQQAIRQALQKAESVICVSISSGLSGTYERMCLAAKQCWSDQVYCVDTQTASAGMAWVVYLIDHLARQHTPVHAIIARIHQSISDHQDFACIAPGSLKYLARGGRISSSSYQIGRMIMLRPLLWMKDGRIVSLVKMPFATDQRMINGMLRLFDHHRSQWWSMQYIILTYTDDRSHHLVKTIVDVLRQRHEYPQHRLYVVQMNPVIWAHVWPGTIGMFAWHLE